MVANLGDFDECPEVGLGEADEAWSEDGLSMLHVVPDVPDFHLPAFPSLPQLFTKSDTEPDIGGHHTPVTNSNLISIASCRFLLSHTT